MLNAPTRLNCVFVLNRLKERHTLVNITGRRYGSQKGFKGKLMRYFTLRGYKKRGLSFDKVYFSNSENLQKSKYEYCKEAQVDVMLEDNPETVLYLRSKGIRTIIFDTEYNRHIDGERVKTWLEFAILLGEIANKESK